MKRSAYRKEPKRHFGFAVCLIDVDTAQSLFLYRKTNLALL